MTWTSLQKTEDLNIWKIKALYFANNARELEAELEASWATSDIWTAMAVGFAIGIVSSLAFWEVFIR